MDFPNNEHHGGSFSRTLLAFGVISSRSVLSFKSGRCSCSCNLCDFRVEFFTHKSVSSNLVGAFFPPETCILCHPSKLFLPSAGTSSSESTAVEVETKIDKQENKAIISSNYMYVPMCKNVLCYTNWFELWSLFRYLIKDLPWLRNNYIYIIKVDMSNNCKYKIQVTTILSAINTQRKLCKAYFKFVCKKKLLSMIRNGCLDNDYITWNYVQCHN